MLRILEAHKDPAKEVILFKKKEKKSSSLDHFTWNPVLLINLHNIFAQLFAQ
jgi:hypothetical protein